MSVQHQLSTTIQYNSAGTLNSGSPHDIFSVMTTSVNWEGPSQATLTSSPQAVLVSPFSSGTNFAGIVIRNTGANSMQLLIANSSTLSQGSSIDLQPGGCFVLFGSSTPGTFTSGGLTDVTKWQMMSTLGTTVLVALAYS